MDHELSESPDLNNIFHLSYNFDLLKSLLEGLLKTQKNMQEEMKQIRKVSLNKDDKIQELEKSLLDIKVILAEKVQGLTPEKINELKTQKENLDKNLASSLADNKNNLVLSPNSRISDRDKALDIQDISSNIGKDTGIKPISDGIDLQVSVANDDITNKIIRKINSVEHYLGGIVNQVNNIPKQKKLIQENAEKIEELLRLKTTFDEFSEKYKDLEKRFIDVENKVKDLDIFEALKIGAGDGGDANMALNLMNNIDKKYNQKFKFIDERILKSDSDIQKMKTETTNIKNSQELNNRNIQNLSAKAEEFEKNINEINGKILNFQDVIDNDVQTKIEKLSIELDDIKKKITTNYDPKIEDMEKQLENLKNISSNKQNSQKENSENDEANAKTYKELLKRMNDLEKSVKLLPSQFNVEPVKAKMKKLEEELNSKISTQMLDEMTEIIKQLEQKLAGFKEQIDTLVEDQTAHNEIMSVRRDMEPLIKDIIDIKNIIQSGNFGDNSNDTTNKIKEFLEQAKFVELKDFTDFQENMVKEFESTSDHFTKLRKIYEELSNTLKQKTGFKDLKALEDDLMAKLEDLKLSSFKKFADKIETGKNIKYLDSQIKHIIEIYIKKMDKGDSWLLAKKPLGGHLCASCENYIGDLKDNNNASYVPWNKYPMRDPNDKLYRIGNGFSKMLQMINVDGDNNVTNNINCVTNFANGSYQTTQNFYNYENNKTTGNTQNIQNMSGNNFNLGGQGAKSNRNNSAGKKSEFPRIVDKKNNNANNEIIEQEDRENIEMDDANEPKITKVYKKKNKK